MKSMPHDLCHHLSHELMNSLTLLISVREQLPESLDDARRASAIYGDDKMTDHFSRSISMVAMAAGKVRAVLEQMSPYV